MPDPINCNTGNKQQIMGRKRKIKESHWNDVESDNEDDNVKKRVTRDRGVGQHKSFSDLGE